MGAIPDDNLPISTCQIHLTFSHQPSNTREAFWLGINCETMTCTHIHPPPRLFFLPRPERLQIWLQYWEGLHLASRSCSTMKDRTLCIALAVLGEPIRQPGSRGGVSIIDPRTLVRISLALRPQTRITCTTNFSPNDCYTLWEFAA